ncbi:MAG: hypothetical protein WCH61_06215, partial [bacterium]
DKTGPPTPVGVKQNRVEMHQTRLLVDGSVAGCYLVTVKLSDSPRSHEDKAKVFYKLHLPLKRFARTSRLRGETGYFCNSPV